MTQALPTRPRLPTPQAAATVPSSRHSPIPGCTLGRLPARALFGAKPRRSWSAAAVVAVAMLGSAPATAAPPPSPPPTGVWLSVELVGDAGARAAALEALTEDTDRSLQPRDAEPPGAYLGSAPSAADAVAWIARHAFTASTSAGEPDRINEVAAPSPGGPELERHGVFVRAWVVTGATLEGGLRSIAWPTDQRELLPPESGWVGAALTVQQAPLFAAPAPTVPPAAQRHAMARRAGGLFVLGWLDRCDARRRCLRWAQVVARDGDRFTAGYLPAYLVAQRDAWVRGDAALPRAQLIRIGSDATQAHLLLIARDRHGALHRRPLAMPLVEGGFPAAEVVVEGEWSEVRVADGAPIRIELNATMDVRVRQPAPSPEPLGPDEPQ